MKLKILFSFFPLCLLASLAMAQTSGTDATQSGKSNAVTSYTNPRLKTPISLIAKDANLSEVLKVLADRSGMNFVSGEAVYKEKLTIILNNTPLDEAINIVVRASGLAYEIIGNSVMIAEADKLKADVGLMTYVVSLKYAPAGEVVKMLSDLTDKVKVDEGGNRIVCYASPRVISEIEKIVEAVDHPNIMVMLETKILEVNMDKGSTYGLDWNLLGRISSTAYAPTDFVLNGVNPKEVTRTPLSMTAVFDLMANNGDAKVLMDSKLTTTNNREAKLLIGEVIPYTVQNYNLSGSGGVNLSVQKEEVGVKLTMTPHVNDEGQITLKIEPEISTITGYGGPYSDIPRTSVRKSMSTVRVENGQTVFLAGLIQEETKVTVGKVPLLGDIPLLGYLFQHRSTKTSKKNLVIEVTPRILNSSEDAMSKPFDRAGLENQGKLMEEELGKRVKLNSEQ